MTDNRRNNHFVIFALILILGLGLALALPWLANSQGLAAHPQNATVPPNHCYVKNATSSAEDDSDDARALQDAVGAASPGDVVKVAGTCKGVETRAGLTQTVYISKSLTLEGGHTESDWTLEPDPHTYTTTLDADDGGRVIVISGTIDVTLDSLFLTGGLADANLFSAGGGIWSNGVLTLTNSIMYSNTAGLGGGMFNNEKSSLVLTNVTLSDNKAELGGGMFNYIISPTTITEVNFFDNKADTGGGMFNNTSSPTMTNVTFSYNKAELGGGMFNDRSSPTMTNVNFFDNKADIGGGMFNNTSSPTMTNVTLSGNVATNFGGGLVNDTSKSTLINATFSGNFASEYGGGMFDHKSHSRVYNSIFWNNRDISSTGIISANIFNDNSIITLTNSLVEDSGGSGSWALDPTSYVDGGDNIDEDPLFILPIIPSTAPTTAGNLRLQIGSPAIDVGNNSFIAGVSTDLDGEPRIVDGNLDGTPTVDMGAYEYQIEEVYVPLIYR